MHNNDWTYLMFPPQGHSAR